MVSVKCAGVGAAKFSKNRHVWCGSVWSEKLLCAEWAGVPKLAAHKYSAKSCPHGFRWPLNKSNEWIGNELLLNAVENLDNFSHVQEEFFFAKYTLAINSRFCNFFQTACFTNIIDCFAKNQWFTESYYQNGMV